MPPNPQVETRVCELCKRESVRFTSHHLVPRSRGGRLGPQVKLCPTCHRQLHAMFSESTLAKELNSIAALRSNPEFSALPEVGQASKRAHQLPGPPGKEPALDLVIPCAADGPGNILEVLWHSLTKSPQTDSPDCLSFR